MISGIFRSRLLAAPRGMATRPTSDRLRETLFNVLGARVAGSRFADLYAGSGAVGIEALSRGAAQVWFAEKAPAAVAAIRQNLRVLGITRGFAVEPRGVAAWLGGVEQGSPEAARADLVFLDPPWEAAGEYASTLGALGGPRGADVLSAGALVVAEHAARSPLAAVYGGLRHTRTLKQGDAALSFYTAAAGFCAEAGEEAGPAGDAPPV